MKAFSSKIYTFCTSVLQILLLIFSGTLLISGLLNTCYSLDMNTQEVLTRWDNPLITIMGLALFVLCFYLIDKWVYANATTRLPILFTITLIWTAGVGIVLVLFSKTVPAADAMSVYGIAESLAINDTSVIHPTGSYLSYYPQQVGLVTFFEVLIRFWNLLPIGMPAYHFIKCVYVVLALLIITFQYRTVCLFADNPRVRMTYLLLIGCNLPFMMYTSFVYGEIPSFAVLSIGLYYYFRLWKNVDQTSSGTWDAGFLKKQLPLLALSLLFLMLSVFLRKNSLVVIIAVAIVTFLQWLKDKRHILLGFVLLCLLGSVTILPATRKYLELRADNTLRAGVPAMSYFAMGMQESSRANGWYNGFNFYTYQDCNMDTELTNSISRDAIKERLNYFKEHPSYAMSFYAEKYLSQWADGTYASRQATLATFGGRRPFFDSVYSGDYSHYYIEYCNAYQNLLYLGLFWFCLKNRRNHTLSLPLYVGLVAVFGGFLFHTIWEANSRYIFLYSLLLLPYASFGIAGLNTYLRSKKPLRIGLYTFFILLLLGASFLLYGYFRTTHYTSDDARRNDLLALKSQDYNALLLSMYSTESLDAENFTYFRGIPTLKAQHSFETLADIGDYLTDVYDSGQTISGIYMGLDPIVIARQYGHHTSLYLRDYQKRILPHIVANSQTHFEILLPYYSLEYWSSLSEKEKEENITAYRNFINIFAGQPNVTIYFFGHEKWLIANHANYESFDSCNQSVSTTILAMTIRDDAYRITPDNMEERFTALQDMITANQSAMANNSNRLGTYQYDFADYEFVFFGDSVIGNFTDSLSIPELVAGNSGAHSYNLAQGGSSATMPKEDIGIYTDSDSSAEEIPMQTLQTIVDAFLAKNPDALSTGGQPRAGLLSYLEAHNNSDGTTKKTCFIISYGLNDYFDGYPVTSSHPSDIHTYQGSIRTAVSKLYQAYPDSIILLQTPNFCSYYENGTVPQSEEGGSLVDYSNAVTELASELSGTYPVYCIDNYHDSGINASNHGEYLSDGCHPNEKGRFLMGIHLLKCMQEIPQS